MGTAIQMYAVAAPANAMASIDVPRDGAIVGVDWSIQTDSPAGDATINVQLSFGSTGQAVNDSRAVISNCVFSADLNTSGGLSLQANKYVSLPDIQVGAGERIYLHATGDAITTTIFCVIYFDFELDRALARRR